jgi:hypothetical protein
MNGVVPAAGLTQPDSKSKGMVAHVKLFLRAAATSSMSKRYECPVFREDGADITKRWQKQSMVSEISKCFMVLFEQVSRQIVLRVKGKTYQECQSYGK